MTDTKCPNKAVLDYALGTKIIKACQAHTLVMIARNIEPYPLITNLLPQEEFNLVQCEHPDDLAQITPGKKKFKKVKRKRK